MAQLQKQEETLAHSLWTLGEQVKAPLEKAIVAGLTESIETYLPRLTQMVQGQKSILDQAFQNIGEFIGRDLEEHAYVQLAKALYGPTSLRMLDLEISYLMKQVGLSRQYSMGTKTNVIEIALQTCSLRTPQTTNPRSTGILDCLKFRRRCEVGWPI